MKINIFTLFDQSTLATGLINTQKVEFAKKIIAYLKPPVDEITTRNKTPNFLKSEGP
jgi:hypothetical protein